VSHLSFILGCYQYGLYGVLICGRSNDIARSAGVIMDRCTRGDNTVSGAAYIPQGGVAVQIQGQ